MLGGYILMKTIYRVLVLGILTMALTAVTASSLLAQDVCADVEAQQAVYKKFTDNYASKDIAQRKIAVEAGKDYVQKYGACPESKDIVAYLNKTIPGIETGIKKKEGDDAKNALFTRFDTALKAKNTADIFSVGKEILATDPNLVDVIIVLATAGYDKASEKPPVDTYNNDAVTYAKSAIQKIEAGAKSTTGAYGVLNYSYKLADNKDYSTPEGAKTNALGWMNYIVGYIDYYRLSKKDEGLSYLYKASTINSTTKNNAALYQTIGLYYRDEVVRLGKEIVDKIAAAGNKETDETKALFALEKGNADRAIDGYARAYKLADTKDKAYKDGLYETVKEIYKLRFEGKTDGVDAYVATLTSKPMPDPATKVEPVIEVVPATATPGATPGTTPTATPTGTTKPATPAATPGATKPASSTTTTKPDTTKVTVTKTDDGNSTSESTTKTPAKKPAPKKKGTR